MLYSMFPDISTAYNLVELHLQNRNLVQARSIFNQIPNTISLDNQETIAYNRYNMLLSIAEQLQNNGKSWLQMDSSQKAILSTIALDLSDKAGLWARSLLSLNNDAIYEHVAIFPTNNKAGDAALINPEEMSYVFKVYPDPAQAYFILEYSLFDKTYKTAKIEIRHVSGTKTIEKNLNEKADQLLFETANMQKGIYHCILKLDGSDYDRLRFTIEGENLNSGMNPSINIEPLMLVYPNPTKGTFNIDYVSNGSQSVIKINDSKGVLIKTLELSNSEGSITVDLSHLSDGLYVVSFIQEGKTVFNKTISLTK